MNKIEHMNYEIWHSIDRYRCQVIFVGEEVSSYLQIRGSVPLFWDQPGINVRRNYISCNIMKTCRFLLKRLVRTRSACLAVPSCLLLHSTNT